MTVAVFAPFCSHRSISTIWVGSAGMLARFHPKRWPLSPPCWYNIPQSLMIHPPQTLGTPVIYSWLPFPSLPFLQLTKELSGSWLHANPLSISYKTFRAVCLELAKQGHAIESRAVFLQGVLRALAPSCLEKLDSLCCPTVLVEV